MCCVYDNTLYPVASMYGCIWNVRLPCGSVVVINLRQAGGDVQRRVLGSSIRLSVLSALDGFSLYTAVRWMTMVDRYWVCRACAVYLPLLVLWLPVGFYYILVFSGFVVYVISFCGIHCMTFLGDV